MSIWLFCIYIHHQPDNKRGKKDQMKIAGVLVGSYKCLRYCYRLTSRADASTIQRAQKHYTLLKAHSRLIIMFSAVDYSIEWQDFEKKDIITAIE